MKMLVLWAVLLASAFILPVNIVPGFLMGLFLGIVWMGWFCE
jgi:hypothetical protein